MPATLTITSYQRLSPGQTPKKILGEGEISIGRGPENDWVLPDPEMVLSKKHCVVSYRDGDYYLTDTSTNGVFLNHAETRLGRGKSQKLNEGDEFVIGDYEIQISFAAASASARKAAPVTAGLDDSTDIFSASDVQGNDPPDPLEEVLSPPQKNAIPPNNAPDDFFDDPLLGGDDSGRDVKSGVEGASDEDDLLGLGEPEKPLWNQHSEADHLPADREFFRTPNAIPDEAFDDLVAGLDDDKQTPAQTPLEPLPGDDPPTPSAPAQDIIPEDFLDDSVILRVAKRPDEAITPPVDTSEAAAENADPAEPDAAAPLTEDDPGAAPDPFAGLDQEQPGLPEKENEYGAVAADSAALFDDDDLFGPDEKPEQLADIPPPSRQQSKPKAPPKAPPRAEPQPVKAKPAKATEQIQAMDLQPPAAAAGMASPEAANRSNTAAAQAFFHGAGLSANELLTGDQIRLMQTLGEVFRQTMDGLMELLRARGNIKNEFRLERTVVGPVKNNALKMMPSFEEAATAMLSKSGKSTWMPMSAAIKESLDDIKAHELAVLAGMEGALSHLLKTFDPAALEKQFSQESVFSSIMPGARKARYWDAFIMLYDKIAKEAEDDFQNFFRKEFARAYEKQQRKLKETG